MRDRLAVVAFGANTGLPVLLRGLRQTSGDLRDQSVGNIIIAALADIFGGFRVEQAGRFLRIRGRVYPAATEPVTLVVHHDDGSITRGESTVREGGRAVRVEI